MDHDGPGAWAVGMGVTILVIGGLLIAVMGSCSGFGNGFIAERKHLQQIPINQNACPYIAAMHKAANEFQSAAPVLDEYIGPGMTLIDSPWPRVRARVQRSLLDLQLTIVVGRPHFPPAIRRRLTATLDAIHTGLRGLPRARNTADLTTKTSDALSKGQTAFGYAGDLVGKQCSVGLGADSPAARPTPQDLAEYACKRAIGRGKFLDAQPTTVGRARALREGGIVVTHPLAHVFHKARERDFAAYCWKRAQYEYVSYAADLGGHSAMIATFGWEPRLCKRTPARPHVCVPPFPTPPPGPPRGEL